MIFNITGGGGGAALNFNVVAYLTEEELLAATPSVNTIGVITDAPITSWLFGSTEPNPAEAGMVWIFTSTSSTVAFNALKKNGIQVYPLSAKQYIGGAWVDKTAKSYQNGEWVAWWNGELFDNGKQFESITGGWVTHTQDSGTTLTIGNTIAYNAGSSKSALARTKNYIPLKNYKTLFITVNITQNGYLLQIQDKNGTLVVNDVKASISSGTYTVDVSQLNDEYYIMVGGHNVRSGAFTKIWLD